jgi:hypothetical protein
MSTSVRPAASAAARLLRGACGQVAKRSASTSVAKLNADGGADKKSGGFFGSFFDRALAPQVAPHSAKFASAKEEIVELQTHNVRPDAKDQYLDAHRRLVDYLNERSSALHW